MNIKNLKKKIFFTMTIQFIYLSLKLLLKSYRYRFHLEENYLEARKQNEHGSIILCCWHEFLLGGILSIIKRKDKNYAPLVSASKDGEFVAQVVHQFGYETVRGSSHRGGKEARELLYQKLKEGKSTGITVDGPRGPRRSCKPGAIDLAIKTGRPIVPYVAIAENKYIFHKSWDQFQFPYPFTTVHVAYGKAISTPTPENVDSDTFETYKKEIEESYDHLEKFVLKKISELKS